LKVFSVAGSMTLKKMTKKRMGESSRKKKRRRKEREREREKTNAQINSQPVDINGHNIGAFLETPRAGSPAN
jgi:hypothetical protein